MYLFGHLFPITMRVLIVEDDALIAKGLRSLVQLEFGSECASVCIAATLSEAMRVLSDCCPDVVVLDAQLPDGSGLDVVKRVEEMCPGTYCICVSGLPAKELISRIVHPRVVRFLPKPFSEEECIAAFRAVFAAVGQQQKQSRVLHVAERTVAALITQAFTQANVQEHEIRRLAKEQNTEERFSERITKQQQGGITVSIHRNRQKEFVALAYEDIVYVQGLNNQSIIVTRQGERHKISKTLGALEAELPSAIFIRTDQSFLVNISCIRIVSDNRVLLRQSDTSLPLARRRRGSVKKQVQDFYGVAAHTGGGGGKTYAA